MPGWWGAGGCDRSRAPHTGATRRLWARKLHLDPGTRKRWGAGAGSVAGPVLGSRASGTSLSARSGGPRASLPHAQQEPWTNHVFISSYTDTHRHNRTEEPGSPQHTLKVSSELRPHTQLQLGNPRFSPPRLPTTKGPFLLQTQVAPVCVRACGTRQEDPGHCPREGSGRGDWCRPPPRPPSRWSGCCGTEPRLRAQDPTRGPSAPERPGQDTAPPPVGMAESAPPSGAGRGGRRGGRGRGSRPTSWKTHPNGGERGLGARRQTRRPAKPQHLGPESGST